MGKKYYCDYCNKSMTSDMVTRERHEQSALHQRYRRAFWYAVTCGFDVSQGGFGAKSPCMQFIREGQCINGTDCPYAHPIPGPGGVLRPPPPPPPKYKLPKGLPKNLPPSLRPPPPQGYDMRHVAQWG